MHAGVSATNSGQLLTPMLLAVVATSTVAGALMARMPRYRFLGTAAVATMIVGLVLLSQVGVRTSSLEVTRDIIIIGAGLGVTFPLTIAVVQAGLPQQLTALGGLAVIVGAVVAALNFQETSRQNREVLELQWRGQVTERFSKAIEQLGESDEGKLDVRVGAIYALEQIAHDSPELHWPIMEVLTAHLREYRKARSQATGTEESTSEAESYLPDLPELPAEAQAIATVIGPPTTGAPVENRW